MSTFFAIFEVLIMILRFSQRNWDKPTYERFALLPSISVILKACCLLRPQEVDTPVYLVSIRACEKVVNNIGQQTLNNILNKSVTDFMHRPLLHKGGIRKKMIMKYLLTLLVVISLFVEGRLST